MFLLYQERLLFFTMHDYIYTYKYYRYLLCLFNFTQNISPQLKLLNICWKKPCVTDKGTLLGNSREPSYSWHWDMVHFIGLYAKVSELIKFVCKNHIKYIFLDTLNFIIELLTIDFKPKESCAAKYWYKFFTW